MRFFVFLLGGLLMIAGATAIVFGIDIIQMERGWTEVIAGATILAAGAVIVGLGCVVAKLDQVLKATTRLPSHVQDAPQAAAPSSSLSEERAVEPASAKVLRSNSDLERGWAQPIPPSIPALAAAPVEASTADLGAPRSNGQSTDVDWAAQVPVSDPTEASDADGPAKTAPAAADNVSAAGEAPAAEGNFEWLERALSGTDEPPRTEARQEISSQSAKSGEPSDHRPQLTSERAEEDKRGPTLGEDQRGPTLGEDQRPSFTPEALAQVEHQPADGHLTSPHDLSDALAPTAADPAILGRYQANGNSYVMFSDGSIEAVTQTGVYRFSSMAELKAFIEAQA